jgi:CheY-like chemotaxis protein
MPRVLVVDDDLDLLSLYTEILTEMGLEVSSAPNGVDALRLALELKPELVLTDWRMPRMDGIELCKALKRRMLLSRPRLILHSSEPIPEPWCADLCLRKPVSLETLEGAVKDLLAEPEPGAILPLACSAMHDSKWPVS